MTDEDRIEQRFKAARERAVEQVRKLDPIKQAIGQAYLDFHGRSPAVDRSAEQDALNALARSLLNNGISGADLPMQVMNAVRSNETLFGAARQLIPEFPEPLGGDRHVWMSSWGTVYHRYRDCTALAEGRRRAGTEGDGLVSIRIAEAMHSPGFGVDSRRPCLVCQP